jgi:hypothetical protein
MEFLGIKGYYSYYVKFIQLKMDDIDGATHKFSLFASLFIILLHYNKCVQCKIKYILFTYSSNKF